MPLHWSNWSNNIGVGEAANIQLVVESYQMIPSSTNEFKLEYASAEGITTNFPSFHLDGTSTTVEGIVSIPSGLTAEYQEIFPVLYEKLDGVNWTQVVSDSPSLTFYVNPIFTYYIYDRYQNNGGNRYLTYTTAGTMPYMENVNGWRCWWYGQRTRPFVHVMNNNCSTAPTSGDGFTIDYSPYIQYYANDTDKFFEAGTWPISLAANNVAKEDGTIYRFYSSHTPVPKATFDITWGTDVLWTSTFMGQMQKTGFSSLGPTNGIQAVFAKRNLKSSPTSFSNTYATGVGECIQFPMKANTKTTVTSNNANFISYDAWDNNGHPVNLDSPTSHVFWPNFYNPTDEVCMAFSNITFGSKTPTITLADTSYSLPAPIVIATGETKSGTLTTSTKGNVFDYSHYDRYSFSASAGQTITITTTGSVLDPAVYICDATGIMIGAAWGVAMNLILTVPATGTYYIELASSTGADIGDYNLHLVIA